MHQDSTRIGRVSNMVQFELVEYGRVGNIMVAEYSTSSPRIAVEAAEEAADWHTIHLNQQYVQE